MDQTIAINDTNILIDFCDIGLTDALTKLELTLWTSDLVVSEVQAVEQKKQIRELIDTGRLLVATFSGEEIGEIAERQARISALSLADCSVLVLAQRQKSILLTGDRVLRIAAEKANLEVHGSLWILDRMVHLQVIETIVACRALLELVIKNPRLPKAACEERRHDWCS